MKIHNQPVGLSVIFFTEMWERFGFYIVQGMLVLYLTQYWKWSDSDSYSITGAFTAFAYLSPILGGYIADKVIGYKSAVKLGGVLLILGYAALAGLGQTFLYISLAIIVVGNGFFKPNIASLLGTFYDKEDVRREAGFTIYYVGINLGVILSTLSSGFVKDWFGWWAGFALASIGLVIGLATFIIGERKFKQYGGPPARNNSHQRTWLQSKITLTLGIVISITLLSLLIHYKEVANVLLFSAALLLIILLVSIAFKQHEKQARNQMLALTILAIIAVVFWAIFFQIFFSLNLFIDRDVNRVVFGHQIPTIAFVSFESIFILLLGPLIARLWYRLDQKKRNPSIPLKFFLGFILTGIAFLLLAFGTRFHDASGLINPLWIPLGYCFITLGEMLISPIALSAVTVLAPARWVGMMMGVYLISIGYGGKLAGVIADFSAVPSNLTNKVIESELYGSAFFKYALLSFIASIVVLLCVPFITRLIKTPLKS